MQMFNIQFREKSSSVFFEKNLFEHPDFYKKILSIAPSFVLLTHTSLLKKIAAPLVRKLKEKKIPYLLLSFPPGEKYKSRKTKEYLENQMFRAKIEKETAIISLGGGVVSDMAGFIAATYLRSLPLIHIPTTLVGMIDAAFGGKTGVNTAYGKNTIGSFYQPDAVFIDSSFLKHLPKEEFKNGMVEMIKYALIFDPKFFSILEEKKEDICSQKPLLDKMIFACVQIKKKMVEEDPYDQGIRRLLGFGHTVGHAIEAAYHYRISHGEALFLGILAESYLSMRKKLLSKRDFERICALFSQLDLSSDLVSFAQQKVLSFLLQDKKRKGGKLLSVLLKGIGEPLVNHSGFLHPIDPKEIEEMLGFLKAKVLDGHLCSLPS
jgi:3-dehydroquinate synthase